MTKYLLIILGAGVELYVTSQTCRQLIDDPFLAYGLLAIGAQIGLFGIYWITRFMEVLLKIRKIFFKIFKSIFNCHQGIRAMILLAGAMLSVVVFLAAIKFWGMTIVLVLVKLFDNFAKTKGEYFGQKVYKHGFWAILGIFTFMPGTAPFLILLGRKYKVKYCYLALVLGDLLKVGYLVIWHCRQTTILIKS